jgi:16S rRNA (guanine(966)-N(2))-methyltransferase RsmD
MRVIAGEAKGRALRTARGSAMRPTAARLRETLFNLVGAEVAGCRFLDLCAGSGSVGIEALSRGAKAAVFVDNHRTAASLVAANLKALGMERRAVVIRRDAVAALGDFARRGEVFDEVFLDPPYDSGLLGRCLPSPLWRAIIRARGRIFVEHRCGAEWPSLDFLKVEDQRRFGDTVLTVFRGAAES